MKHKIRVGSASHRISNLIVLSPDAGGPYLEGPIASSDYGISLGLPRIPSHFTFGAVLLPYRVSTPLHAHTLRPTIDAINAVVSRAPKRPELVKKIHFANTDWLDQLRIAAPVGGDESYVPIGTILSGWICWKLGRAAPAIFCLCSH